MENKVPEDTPRLPQELVRSQIVNENQEAIKAGSVQGVQVDDRAGVIKITLGIMVIARTPPLYMFLVPQIKLLMKAKYEKQYVGYSVQFVDGFD